MIIIVILNSVVAFWGRLAAQVTVGGFPSLDVFSQLIHVLGDRTSLFKARGELLLSVRAGLISERGSLRPR